jgi:two-component system chemotaxis response regulator CheB
MTIPVKVLIVDDSSFMRRVIREILEVDSQLKVVGTSSNGKDCLEKIKLLQPDVVTVDIDMPGMSGMSVIRHIMIQSPVPIVVFSSLFNYGDVTFEALQLGVVDFVPKPSGMIFEDKGQLHNMIIDRVKNASGVNLNNIRRAHIKPMGENRQEIPRTDPPGLTKMITLGAGLSGANSVIRLAAQLSPTLPCAMVALLEIAPQVLPAFVEKFNRHVPWRIMMAEDGQRIEPGVCYIGSYQHAIRVAPDRHGVPCFKKEGALADPLDTLFKSSAEIYKDNAIGVLLNGLGSDGAAGFLSIKAYDGVTIALQTDCCVYPNLAQNAIAHGAVTQVVDESRLHQAIEKMMIIEKKDKPRQLHQPAYAVTRRFNFKAISLHASTNVPAVDGFRSYKARILTVALARLVFWLLPK